MIKSKKYAWLKGYVFWLEVALSVGHRKDNTYSDQTYVFSETWSQVITSCSVCGGKFVCYELGSVVTYVCDRPWWVSGR